MTKADLIEEVSRVVEMTRKDSEVIVEAIFDSIVRALRTGDKIEIRGYGSFRTRQRQPRVGRNPKTGTRVEVPSKRIPYFKPSKELKDLVNQTGDKGTPECADTRWRLRAFRIPARRWIISGAHGGTDTSVPPSPLPLASSARNPRTISDERESRSVYRGKHNFILLNLFPYTSGHLMVAPYAHVATLEEADEEIVTEMMLLTRLAQGKLRQAYRAPGFNVGMNIGSCAGAGIAGHIHMHVLPRWAGRRQFHDHGRRDARHPRGHRGDLPEALRSFKDL